MEHIFLVQNPSCHGQYSAYLQFKSPYANLWEKILLPSKNNKKHTIANADRKPSRNDSTTKLTDQIRQFES